MAKKEKKQEAGAPGWIVTFADLMSLLLTFFVLLLSFADTDPTKFKEASGSLRNAFGVEPDAVFDNRPSSVSIFENNYASGGEEWQKLAFPKAKIGVDFESFCAFNEELNRKEREELQKMTKRIREKLVMKSLDGLASVKFVNGKVEVELNYNDYFVSGSSSRSQEGWAKLKEIISIIDEEELETDIQVSSLSPKQLSKGNMKAWGLSSRRVFSLMSHMKRNEYKNIKNVGLKDQSTEELTPYFKLNIELSKVE